MQRQAYFTVMVVLENDETVDEAEEMMTEILNDADIMAHITCEKIVVLEDNSECLSNETE